jgi:hypothetical protein
MTLPFNDTSKAQSAPKTIPPVVFTYTSLVQAKSDAAILELALRVENPSKDEVMAIRGLAYRITEGTENFLNHAQRHGILINDSMDFYYRARDIRNSITVVSSDAKESSSPTSMMS